MMIASSAWRGSREVEWQKHGVSKELMVKETERSRPLRLDDKGAVCLNRITCSQLESADSWWAFWDRYRKSRDWWHAVALIVQAACTL